MVPLLIHLLRFSLMLILLMHRAFFCEAVDGSDLDFVSSVTIDLHPTFAAPRRVLTKQPFVLEGAGTCSQLVVKPLVSHLSSSFLSGYGAFQTQFHFAFKAPFDKNDFSVVHMLTLSPGTSLSLTSVDFSMLDIVPFSTFLFARLFAGGKSREMDFELSVH
jgi:hypothetical protein